MTVASGQFGYLYTTNGYGDEFNFFLPDGRAPLAPSSILIEEIMFALSVESNRKAESENYPLFRGTRGVEDSRHNNIAADDKPSWGGLYPKWINQAASISGLFNPSATGGHLDGTLPVTLGNTPIFAPAHLGSRWLYDLKLQFRDVVAYISQDSNATQQEIFQDWLDSRGYSDTYQQSGIFFHEEVDLSVSDQITIEGEPPHWTNSYNHGNLDAIEYQQMFTQDLVFSGTWLSSRHLNEVRIQPIPYLGGSSGTTLTSNSHDKTDLTLSPIKPTYARTDGTLAFGYGDKALMKGDVLISGMSVMFSGGGLITEHANIVTGEAPSWSPIPNSGEFTVPSLASGYYRVALGMDHSREGVGLTSGLFPWGTGIQDVFTSAIWPRNQLPPNDDVYTGNRNGDSLFVEVDNGTDAFVVTDFVWANQPDLGGISQSGLIWYNPINIIGRAGVATLDLYGPSGISPIVDINWLPLLWGREFENIRMQSSPSRFWGSKGWCHKQSNSKIYRCHTSGTSATLPGTAINSGIFISEWDIPLRFSSLNKYSIGTITRGSLNFFTHVSDIQSISWDGSNFVCEGNKTHSSGLTSAGPFFTVFGGLGFFLDTSFTVVNTVQGHVFTGARTTSPYIGNRKRNIRYINKTNEYLVVASPSFGPPAEAGLTSGMYSVSVYDFSTGGRDAHSGLQTETFHVPLWSDNGIDKAENVMDFGNRSALRITDFMENENNDKVYAFCVSDPSGAVSSRARYVCELDTTSHPYTLGRTWLLGSENTASQISINLDRSHRSNYIQEFNY